ncbi:MAG: class I SAM-dependent methyltransferase [bacterium]|nr:class I SAM-dependent methyltransferase [bacterium]
MSEIYLEHINDLLRSYCRGKKTVHVLEAGCGSGSRIDMCKNVVLTGIDISLDQLNKNEYLDNKISGDIQKTVIKDRSQDFVICWDVLEHLNEPEKALDNLINMIKENGYVIIGLPNLMSLKGIITKITPYKFHYWIYKRIYRYDNTPFPTHHRLSIRPGSLKKFGRTNNLKIEYFEISDRWIRKLNAQSKTAYLLYMLTGCIISLLTLGAISTTRTEIVIIYTKDRSL